MSIDQVQRCLGFGIVSFCAAVSTASAGFIPAVSINVQVSDSGGVIFDQTANPVGVPQGPFGFMFSYDLSGGDFSAYGDVNVNPAPGFFNGFLNTVTHANNSSGETLMFVITITGDLDAAGLSQTDWTLGSTWTVDGPNPLVSTLPNQPLTTGFLNGSEVGSLYPDPTGMGGGDPLNLNTTPVSGTLPGGVTSGGLRFAFELSGNDNTVTTNTEIFFIPAPAGLALLAMAGVVGRRRRRAE